MAQEQGAKVLNLYRKGEEEERACARASARPRAGGFTLIDVMVSIAVIGLLVSLMMPSLTQVRETARRVVCSSNIRQHGLGLAMYADDFQGQLPGSKFARPFGSIDPPQPREMMLARTTGANWDGIGHLFESDYLNAAGVFYCPAHHGEHPYSAYASSWPSPYPSDIFTNYQFRAVDRIPLYNLPQELALVTDGMRTREDFNHGTGCNVLRAELSVAWFADPGRQLLQALPDGIEDASADAKVNEAWLLLDDPPNPQ